MIEGRKAIRLLHVAKAQPALSSLFCNAILAMKHRHMSTRPLDFGVLKNTSIVPGPALKPRLYTECAETRSGYAVPERSMKPW